LSITVIQVPPTHQLGVMAAMVIAAALGALQPSNGQTKAPRVDQQSGPYLFRVFCASCHGESGKGDGPVADLLKRPPGDMTQIARRAGGSFPRDAVIRTIDGRSLVPAHGPREMPIWGDRLKITEGQSEKVIQERIAAIASHLESLQAK
jgi:mono/diheme cytochrome c family protein